MQVKKFFKTALLFIFINLIILCLSIYIIHAVQSSNTYHNWETDSDLLMMPENKPVDLLLMGSSHARIFTRDKNHLRVEDILHKTMIDIGKGGGEGGIITNLIMLKEFYARGNSAKQIVYFIDAWPFFTAKWNEKSYFLTNEPMDIELTKLCLQYNVDKDVLLNYYKSKYTMDWLQRKPKTREINDEVLQDISQEAIQKRLASLYIEPYDANQFNHYAKLLEDVVQTAKLHGSELIFIFPATLLDDNRGKEKVTALLQKFKIKYNTPYYDYSNTILDYHYYYDHDHLNSNGIIYFTKKYLKPVLEKQ
jgi:hypothetical protein